MFLPLTPGKHKGFVTLLGPLLADIIAKICQAPLEVVLNTADSFYSRTKEYDLYLDQLKKMNINLCNYDHDESSQYHDYIERTVQSLQQKTVLRFSQAELAVCQCGKVEIPQQALKVLLKEKRSKLIKVDGEIQCAKCHGQLRKESQKVLQMNFCQNPLKVNVWPKRYAQEFKVIQRRFQQNPFIVSRHYRSGQKVNLQGQTIVLDSDFRWMAYANYFNSEKAHICLVVGSDCLNHAAKIICLAKTIDPTIEFSLIVHPLIQVQDSNGKISELEINQYLEICKIPAVSRSFLTLGIQWTKGKAILPSKELYLVQHSIFPWQEFEDVPKLDVDFSNVGKLIDRSSMLGLLKSLRGKRPLTPEQVILKNNVPLI